MPRKVAPPPYSASGDTQAQDAGDQPEPRTLTFILRFIELLLTGSTCGLTFWELLKGLAVPSGGETSAGHAAVFIFLAGLSGLASAVSGLTALCFKFDLLEALEPHTPSTRCKAGLIVLPT
ncbi:hypothetical protein VSDG_06070 [Cytospora chrysosperma]|uniref:Uncharacterized protein n=1 Tax=Cytospora chrysosperma TaxID=252740 RepID=A0A423VW64_CYTCH|nr:hypothetical protein VSDG_06070 [Valsa sordida]